jgi:hypothetical protein
LPRWEHQREARRTSIVQLSIKYALFENGHHPETIVELSREIELDTGGNRPPPLTPASAA